MKIVFNKDEWFKDMMAITEDKQLRAFYQTAYIDPSSWVNTYDGHECMMFVDKHIEVFPEWCEIKEGDD